MTPKEQKEFEKLQAQERAEKDVEFCEKHPTVAKEYGRCWKCVKEGKE